MALNGTGFTGTGQLGGEVNLQGSTGSGYDSSSFDADFAQKSVGNLSDVELGTMTGRDVLLWDSANAQFENRALLEADLPTSVMFENENISLLNNDVPYFDTAGVGLDNSTSTVNMAIDTMANLGAPPASNDEFPIYDQSAGSHNSVTFGNLEQGIDAANISSGFADGSVIFSNGGQLAEDNANFFWDVNNARLALGKNTANETLDINGNAAISNKVILSPISSPVYAEGQLWYSADTTTLNFQNDRSGVTLNIGEETWLRVRNNSGATISNGEAVYINGFDTGSGFPTVELAQADSATTADMVGLATEDIANNASGMITTYGLVREVDTSAYSAGDTLYLSPNTPGALTTTEPSSPNFSVRVGKVSRSNVGGGQILVGVSDIREAIYTQGSIPYSDANGRLIDDNANLSWDGTDIFVGGNAVWHSGDFTSADISNWDTAYDRSPTGLSGSGNGTLTLTKQDGATLTENLGHNHTSSEITDFIEAVYDNVANILSSGTGISISRDDPTNNITVTNTGASSSSALFSGAEATRDTSYSLANNTAEFIPWDGEVFDTDSYHDAGTNPTRLTVPNAGKYYIGGTIEFSGWATLSDGRFVIQLYKNGAWIREFTDSNVDADGTDGPAESFGTIVDAAQGDYFELQVRQASGGSRDITTRSVFYAARLQGSGPSQLADLNDVTSVNYTSGRFLRANGSEYVSAQISKGDIPSSVAYEDVANTFSQNQTVNATLDANILNYNGQDTDERYNDNVNAFNIKLEWGATGDGTTDDTTAIQNAMTYAGNNPGTTIYFPEGIYMINSSIEVPTKTKVVGEGMNTSIIRNLSTATFTLITPYNPPNASISPQTQQKPMMYTDQSGVEDVVVSDIGLDWNDVDGSGDNNSETEFLLLEADNSVIERVRFFDMKVWGTDSNYQTDGSNIFIAFSENCHIRECVFGYTDYESVATQFISRYIYIYKNHFNINKPTGVENQRHAIQSQVPKVTGYESDLQSDFGRYAPENIYVYENTLIFGSNITQGITFHDGLNGEVTNNELIYTSDVDSVGFSIRFLDGAKRMKCLGNTLDLSDFSISQTGNIYHAIMLGQEGAMPSDSIVASDNVITVGDPSENGTLVFFGVREDLDGSSDTNISITNNIAKLQNYDDNNTIKLINAKGSGWNIRGNVFELESPTETITTSGPVFADCTDLSDFNISDNIVRGTNIGQGVTYSGTIGTGIVKNNILDPVLGTKVPDNSNVNSADTTDYIYDYGGDVQSTGSERFLVYNGVGSNNTFIDGTDSIENQAVIPLAGKIKKLTIRHAGNLSTNNATATIYVNGVSQGTFNMTGGSNSSDQGDFDITVSALDYVSISINGSGTAPGFCVANSVMR